MAVKVVAETADVLIRPAAGLVVLLYHRVHPTGSTPSVSVDLPVSAFDEQMAALAAAGRVIGLDDAVARLITGQSVAGQVVVTFDDGTADFVEHAVPVLAAHAVPATLYVATDHIETGRWFPDRGRPASWAALAEARSTGLVIIGSHTHTHALLDRLGPRAVAGELDRSIELIEDRLSTRPHHFAYPKARPPSLFADAVVRRRFRSAALAGTRANPPDADVHRLARSPVQIDDRRRWFDRKLAGGMGLEDDLRRLLDRHRQAGAST